MDLVRDFIATELAQLQRIVRVPDPPLHWGVDLACHSDVEADWRETRVDTIEALAQDVFHLVTTPRGTSPDGAETEDVRALLSAGLTQAHLNETADKVSGAASGDDRVALCSVTITPNADGSEVEIALDITPENSELREFRLILAVTDGRSLLRSIDGIEQ